MSSPSGTSGKKYMFQCRRCKRLRDMISTPGLGRYPGEGNGNPLQYSCLENSMDRGTWWTAVHGIATVRRGLETKQQQQFLSFNS